MSEFKNRCFHFYAQLDGSYAWPNSAEGDLLKIGFKEHAALSAALRDLWLTTGIDARNPREYFKHYYSEHRAIIEEVMKDD